MTRDGLKDKEVIGLKTMGNCLRERWVLQKIDGVGYEYYLLHRHLSRITCNDSKNLTVPVSVFHTSRLSFYHARAYELLYQTIPRYDIESDNP